MSERPDRTTMEGMIWNANHVLEQALLPGASGINPSLFRDCVGLILISIVEVGFIFSGNVGTGIILKKRQDGGWSPPCACGLTGVGWGFLVGGSVKDVLIFLFDDATLRSAASDSGLKLGVQAEATLGPIGRTGKLDLNVSSGGVGSQVAIAYSKGAFLGISIEGSVVGARHAVNASFYGKPHVGPRAILYDADAVTVPTDRVTLLPEVYQKLQQLASGVASQPTPAEAAKKTAAKARADEAARSANAQADVVRVDAAAEAAREQAAASASS